MAATKIFKTPAYYSRFQVKNRRRREGKTDYQARRNLIRLDGDKYNQQKYRFVVRSTNTRILCQVAYATISGDRIIASADSSELVGYGMPVGLTNYSAAYATGLLCARRALAKVGLADICVGKTEATGEEYSIFDEELERDGESIRPFKAVLDTGLVRTTTGNRVFGALKGACDGGMHIPHSNKRFPGYVRGEDGAADSYDAEVHRARIFGTHVADYMKLMKEEDPDKYEAHFSRYIKAGVTPENFEEKIKAVHAAIRANPEKKSTKKDGVVKAVRDGNVVKHVLNGKEVKIHRPIKLSKAQRAERVQLKIAEVARLAAAAME